MSTYGRQPGGNPDPSGHGPGYGRDDHGYGQPGYGQPDYGYGGYDQGGYDQAGYDQGGWGGAGHGQPGDYDGYGHGGSEYGSGSGGSEYGGSGYGGSEYGSPRANSRSGASGGRGGEYGAARSSGAPRPPSQRNGDRPRGQGSGAKGGGKGSSAKGAGKGANGKGRPVKVKTPWWARITIGLGALVILASVAGMLGVKSLVGQVDKAVPTAQLIDHGGKAVDISGAINMLMIGLDTRDDNPALGSRSDSIIIGHIPATHDAVYLMSIPRDTYVAIPPNPATGYSGGHDKINGAFTWGSQRGGGVAGGVKLLQKTLQQDFGLTFQGALVVNFDGFRDIVTKLGGVTMYVDETTRSLHHGYINNDPNQHAAPYHIHPDGTPGSPIPGVTQVVYKKGRQHLSAYDALDYVRCRDWLPNTDYDRQRHQQQFIKALLEEAYQKGISDPAHISSFLDSLKKAFTFDPGGRQPSDWIFTLKGISPTSMITMKTNNGTYNTTMVGKLSTESLSQTSLDLIEAIKTDKMNDFIALHPDWVTQSQ